MSTQPGNNSKTYTDVPKTRLSSSFRNAHANLRRDCEYLWATKARHLDFRLVRTSSWGHGRGMSYYWMRKFGDNFVIGQRQETAPKENYPDLGSQLQAHINSYNGHLPMKLVPEELQRPSDWFWSRPWFIVKKDRTFIPAFVDKSRDNMMWGMGIGNLCFTGDSNLMDYREMWHMGAAIVGNWYSCLPKAFVHGGLLLEGDDCYAYGNTIFDPVLQIYDKGLWNRGREAFFAMHDLLLFYVDRHGILEANDRWWGSSWGEEFLWRVYEMYHSRGLEGMTPHWVLEAQKAKMEDSQPSWMRSQAMLVNHPSKAQIRKEWKAEARRLGIARFVERGTPLYNEVSPMEPLVVDYDRLIRAN